MNLDGILAGDKAELLQRFSRVTDSVLNPDNPLNLINAYFTDCNILLKRYEENPEVTVRISTDTIKERVIEIMRESGSVNVYELYRRRVIRENEFKGAGKSLGAIAREQGWVKAGKMPYRKGDGERSHCVVYKIPS